MNQIKSAGFKEQIKLLNCTLLYSYNHTSCLNSTETDTTHIKLSLLKTNAQSLHEFPPYWQINCQPVSQSLKSERCNLCQFCSRLLAPVLLPLSSGYSWLFLAISCLSDSTITNGVRNVKIIITPNYVILPSLALQQTCWIQFNQWNMIFWINSMSWFLFPFSWILNICLGSRLDI